MNCMSVCVFVHVCKKEIAYHAEIYHFIGYRNISSIDFFLLNIRPIEKKLSSYGLEFMKWKFQMGKVSSRNVSVSRKFNFRILFLLVFREHDFIVKL